MITPDSIKEKMKDLRSYLSEYNLDARSKKEIENLYKILLYRKENTAPASMFRAGFLLVTEYEEYGLKLVTAIQQYMKKEGLIRNAHKRTERDMYNGIQIDAIPTYADFLIIYGCEAPDPDDREEREFYKWQKKFYKNLPQKIEERDQCIVFAIVTPSVIDKNWKYDNQRYYRTFNHHLTLTDKTVDQIYQMTIEELEKKPFGMTEQFCQDLQEYIEVIYPKADLKQDAFVKDLVNLVITRYYTLSNSLYMEEGKPTLTYLHVPYKRMPKSYEDVIASLSEMVGMEAVAEQFRKVYYTHRYQPKGSKLRLHMAFMGAPGTGKTTVAKHMAEMLHAMGALKTPKLTVAKHEDLVSGYVGMTPGKIGEVIERAKDGVLFIDEAYELANAGQSANGSQSPEQQALNVLIQAMENESDRLVVIFAGYSDAIERLLDMNEGLRSRVPHKILFPDYNEQQLMDIFENLCKINHVRLQDDAARAAVADRIRLEKSQKDFGNARTIENIFNEIFAAINEREPGATKITKEDVARNMPAKDTSTMDQYQGFEEIKERISIYTERASYIHMLRKKGIFLEEPAKHMIFYGNPGTGKTMVAKAMANDLYRAGVLANNRLTVVNARDIISHYRAGEALEAFLTEARGGVLFIDEAYGLLDNGGSEVITKLLTEMENNNGTVIIFAGYVSEMYQFVNSNPGLNSRIANSFYFPDYTLEQLTKMYKNILTSFKFEVDPVAVESASEVIRFYMDMDNFGNGRFIRKMVDKTIENKAVGAYDEENLMRIENMHVPTIEEMKVAIPYGDMTVISPEEISMRHKIRTAVHEMGHTMLHMALIREVPVKKVTVDPIASAYGYMAPAGAPEVHTNEYYRNEICVCLGGRNAELLIFGNHSTGCSEDYRMAQNYAKAMIQYAMVEDLGDTDITPILQEADQRTTEILKKNKRKLQFLADALLKRKTIETGELYFLSEFFDKFLA